MNNHFRMKLSRLTRAAQDSFSRVTATLAESVNGIRVTQGFVRQDTNAGLFRSLLSDHSRYNIALARTSAILAPLLELNSQFFVAILLIFGGWRVFHHAMEPADLIMFFLLANFFFSPFTIIGNQYNQALVAMAGAERIFCLIDTKPDWEDAPAAAPLADPRGGAGPGGGMGARVEFRGVSFGYDPARLVLHDINFTAEPGQTVALVGHTGSGKSSIINLVSKFYLPTAGEVLIDGREIRTVTSRSLHRQMGMVQQQNFLFSGTVLDNIRLSRPGRQRGGRPGRGRSGSAASTCSRRCRTACTPRSASAARASPSASASSCASCARCSPTRGSSSSTRRRARSTPSRRRGCRRRSRRSCAAARASSWRTASARSARRPRARARPGPHHRARHASGAAGEGRPLRRALPAVRAGRRQALRSCPRKNWKDFSRKIGDFPSRNALLSE